MLVFLPESYCQWLEYLFNIASKVMTHTTITEIKRSCSQNAVKIISLYVPRCFYWNLNTLSEIWSTLLKIKFLWLNIFIVHKSLTTAALCSISQTSQQWVCQTSKKEKTHLREYNGEILQAWISHFLGCLELPNLLLI